MPIHSGHHARHRLNATHMLKFRLAKLPSMLELSLTASRINQLHGSYIPGTFKKKIFFNKGKWVIKLAFQL